MRSGCCVFCTGSIHLILENHLNPTISKLAIMQIIPRHSKEIYLLKKTWSDTNDSFLNNVRKKLVFPQPSKRALRFKDMRAFGVNCRRDVTTCSRVFGLVFRSKFAEKLFRGFHSKHFLVNSDHNVDGKLRK